MLQSVYTIEMDTIDKDAWSRVLLASDDANIYQTWSYGAVRWGEKNLSHLLLKKGGGNRRRRDSAKINSESILEGIFSTIIFG